MISGEEQRKKRHDKETIVLTRYYKRVGLESRKKKPRYYRTPALRSVKV